MCPEAHIIGEAYIICRQANIILPTASRSEVRSADEVALVDTVYGADGYALAASCAQRVVDGCEIILDGDGTVGTGLLALHTADTAVGARLTRYGTLVVVRALYHNSGRVVDKMNDRVGAFAYADAAAYTLAWVNSGYTVVYGNSVLGAY